MIKLETKKVCSGCQEAKDLELFRVGDSFRNRCKRCRRRGSQVRKKYGITQREYEQLFGKQSGRCAICHTSKLTKYNRLCVDHDHETGQVRGLLCHNCNRGLGGFCDDPTRLLSAIDYLARN